MNNTNLEAPEIIYEDNHLLVANKKGGQLVQGDKTGDIPITEELKKYLKIKYNKPGNVFVGLAHRLDRPVSGVMVFAKTSKALSRLNILFRDNHPDKIYLAIVSDRPQKSSGRLINNLEKNQQQNKSYVRKKASKNTKEAILDYELIASKESFHLLKVRILTGRHHQIRCQLANIGCPIKGDLKYGYPNPNKDGNISLHSFKLKLIHPVKKEAIELKAMPPKSDVWYLFSDFI
jgi:23S rRNA pseudouridine1911/1915/1917 synthase